MSETLNSHHNNLALLDCGAVQLVYNYDLVEAAVTEYLPHPGQERVAIPLAEPYFDRGFAPHILDAYFDLPLEQDSQPQPTGIIRYDVHETWRHRRYTQPHVVLSHLHRHLSEQLLFAEATMQQHKHGLTLQMNSQEFTIVADKHEANPSDMLLAVECQDSHPDWLAKDVIDTASIWAYVCDFVVRLRSGKHTLVMPGEVTPIALGPVAELSSDIEVALLLEITKRRGRLGKSAILPRFDDRDIMPATTQALFDESGIEPAELPSIATAIVNQKSEAYQLHRTMSDITQADIVAALAAFVRARDGSN